MATKQSKFFTGMARTPIPHPVKAGSPCEIIFTHVFSTAVAETDVLELVTIPPGCRLTHVDFVSANLGSINFDLGLMSGTPGDATPERTCGAEIFDDQAAGTAAAATLAKIAAIAAMGDAAPKSIGFVPSAAITAATNKTLTLRIRYVS